MSKLQSRNDVRLKRHARVRAKISGTPECPRLNVFRSNAHIHAQALQSFVMVCRLASAVGCLFHCHAHAHSDAMHKD